MPASGRLAGQPGLLAVGLAGAVARGRGGGYPRPALRADQLAVGARRFTQPPQNPGGRLPHCLHRQLQPGRPQTLQAGRGRGRMGGRGAALRRRGGAGIGGGVLWRLGGGKRAQPQCYPRIPQRLPQQHARTLRRQRQ